jgi:hypothetical protein
MEKLFNIIIILCGLYLLSYYFKNNKSTFENTFFNKDMNKKLESHKVVPTEVEFDYDLREVDKKYLKEQEEGIVMNTINPNIWLESNIDNKPVYKSLNKSKDESIAPFDYIENKTRNSHKFNESRIKNIGGVMNENTVGKSIQEIYDNSLMDYKKLVPNKNNTIVDNTNNVRDAASELAYITSDMWLYDNEKQENGGEIVNGLFAFDNSANNSVAIY